MPKAGPSGRPSMVDVGRLAGVSAQTVSRYFTGVGYVGTDTRERIREAIDQLGYVPHQAARNLRAARTHTIGVLTIGALNYGSSGVLTGIGRSARTDGVTVMIAQLDLPDSEEAGWEDEARRVLAHFASVRVDGVIVSSPVPHVERVLDGWDSSTPISVVSAPDGSVHPRPESPSYSAARRATAYLVSLGHTRVLHLAGPMARIETHERERGYRDAMVGAALEPMVLTGARDWGSTSGHRAGIEVDPRSFTAVFAANDEIALGFMSALDERGLRAPEDYSIVGVDDMPAAAYFSPPLTTMRLDFIELGRLSFTMLREQILSGDAAQFRTVEPELIVRASTAPPKGA